MNVKDSQALKQIQRNVTFLYCILMFSFFLFYMQNGYFNITAAKRQCFVILSGVYLFIQMILTWMRWGMRGCSLRPIIKEIHRFSISDWAMLVMLCSHTITTWTCEYTQDSLYGYAGRGMGLVYSFLIVLAYFFVSRQLRQRDLILQWLLGCVSIVIVLGLIHALGMDPFHQLAPLHKEDLHRFLSTIGNITFFAHLITMTLPIAIFLFDDAEDFKHRILYGGFILLAFCGIYISHVDSAYLGLIAILTYYFFHSVTSVQALKKLLMILFLGLAGIKLLVAVEQMGIAMYWDGISALLVHSPWVDLLLIADVIFLWLLKRHAFMKQMHLHYLRLGVGIAVIGCFCVAVGALIYFTWIRPDISIGVWSSYLRLDDAWGSMRGFLWNALLPLFFSSFTLTQKLFGQGLDCTRLILTAADTGEVNIAPFDNAHNEYIQYLITTGMIGTTSYLCAYLSTIVELQKHGKQNAYMQGIVALLIGHGAFALTGLNQPITTPLLFLFIAIAQAYVRNNDTHLGS